MEPVRSSLVAGAVATVVLAVALFVVDLAAPGTEPFVFATVAGLCELGGPPYCSLESPSAFLLTLLAFVALFAVAWPLLFAGFTWGLPGKSGVTHGLVFALLLWAGYAIGVVQGVELGGGTYAENTPLLVAVLFAYLVYGAVLGGAYDHLAAHRTLLD